MSRTQFVHTLSETAPAGRRRADQGTLEAVARVAHEIRQPIGAALTAAHVLRDRRDQPSSDAACAVLMNQFDRLNRLVDDLLDASRGELGLTTLHLERVDFRNIIGKVVDAIRQQAVEKGQQIEISCPAEPAWIDADPIRLQQVVSNILCNAVAYTDAGGQISLSLAHDDGYVRLVIRDSGRGIAPGLLPRVFELFTRGDDLRTHGLGAGLAIARQIVELHGGKLWASSPGPGGGSEFTVALRDPRASTSSCRDTAAEMAVPRRHAELPKPRHGKQHINGLICDLMRALQQKRRVVVGTFIGRWVARLTRFLRADQGGLYEECGEGLQRLYAWSREPYPLLAERLTRASFSDPHPIGMASQLAIPTNAGGRTSYLVFCSGEKRTWPADLINRLGIAAGIIADVRAGQQNAVDMERLAGRLITAQENERRRIGRELHDHISQRLFLVSLGIDQAAGATGLKGELQAVRTQITDLAHDVHDLSYRLHPSTLEHLGLLPALQRLAAEVEKVHGLRLSVEARRLPRCSQAVALCLFRIAEEGLSNIVRHSGARAARIELAGSRGGLRLHIEDTGKGFDAGDVGSSGLGLASMRERLRLLKGTLKITSEPGRGTRIDALVPREAVS
jgi:signal transduction histidine kinase